MKSQFTKATPSTKDSPVPPHNRLICSAEKEWKFFISQCQVKVHVEITCAKRPGSPRTSCLCRSISLKVIIPPLRSLSPARGYIKQCVSIFPIGIDHPAARTKCIGFDGASSPTATRVALSRGEPRCQDLDPMHGDCCCAPASAPPAGEVDGGILYAVYS